MFVIILNQTTTLYLGHHIHNSCAYVYNDGNSSAAEKHYHKVKHHQTLGVKRQIVWSIDVKQVAFNIITVALITFGPDLVFVWRNVGCRSFEINDI